MELSTAELKIPMLCFRCFRIPFYFHLKKILIFNTHSCEPVCTLYFWSGYGQNRLRQYALVMQREQGSDQDMLHFIKIDNCDVAFVSRVGICNRFSSLFQEYYYTSAFCFAAIWEVRTVLPSCHMRYHDCNWRLYYNSVCFFQEI